MKLSVIIMLAISSILVSCSKDAVQDSTPGKEDGVYEGAVEVTFSAVTDQTKTSIGELVGGHRKITWVKDDEIAILFSDKRTTSKAESSGESTKFVAKVDPADYYYAVYPSSAGSLDGNELTVTIPSTQNVSSGFGSVHYAAAVAVDNNFAFKNLCGWIKFTVPEGSEVKRIVVSGNGEQAITGNITVTFNETGNIATSAISGVNSELIVDIDGPGEYYAAVLPGMNLANGVGFRFYPDHSTDSDKEIGPGVFNSKPLAVERGDIVNLGDLGITAPVKGKICWEDGTPVAGIQVSDGFTITRTDAQGCYSIEKRNAYAQWVYYTIPADAAVQTGPEGMPCFYKALHVNTQEYDFTLKKAEVENRFRILALGDPQVREANNGLYRFNNETAPDIREYVASKQSDMPTYAVVLGDLVHNKWYLYPQVKQMLSVENLSVPCFCVIGNHDHEFSASDPIPDLRSQRKYEAAMGPVNYSFERGNVHCLVLDNIVHQGKSETSCTDELCERVMEWAREDLKSVSREKSVMVFMHAQLTSETAPELFQLLSEFKEARVVGGHLHYLNNLKETVNGKVIRNDDVCTTNGVDWCAQVAGGGEPMGYASYELENGSVKNQIYKSTGKPEGFQLRLYRTSDFPPFEYSVQGNAPRTYEFGVSGDGMIVANVWNATDEWTFEVYENGVKTDGTLEQMKMHDAWSCWYFYKVLGRNTYSYSRKSAHMFWYELKDKNASSVKVKAKDGYGNVFEQDVFTTREESDYPMASRDESFTASNGFEQAPESDYVW